MVGSIFRLRIEQDKEKLVVSLASSRERAVKEQIVNSLTEVFGKKVAM